jgi:hypothetical protein
MHTLKLIVNDDVYDKLVGFLSKFSKDEIDIVSDISEFERNKKYLEGELREILNGEAHFMEINEAEHRLESIIKKHEAGI